MDSEPLDIAALKEGRIKHGVSIQGIGDIIEQSVLFAEFIACGACTDGCVGGCMRCQAVNWLKRVKV